MRQLSESQIKAGRVLLERLDNRSFAPDAALWYYSAADEEWKLILAGTKILQSGPREGYRTVQKAIAGGLIEGAMAPEVGEVLQLRDVVLLPPSDPLITTIRKIARTTAKHTEIRLTRNVVNGVAIEDAYVYRLR